MRVYKCNRCNTIFQTPPDYSIMRKPKIENNTLTSAAWIDLCASCTAAFLSWLHPNQENRESDSSE